MTTTTITKPKSSLAELPAGVLVPEAEQPYEVPENWVWVRLGSVNDRNTITVDPKNYENDIFELYSIPSFDRDEPEILAGKEIGSSKQVVEKNDILLCKINPRINRVWMVKEKKDFQQIASTEWIVVGNKKLYPYYLLYLLRSPFFRKLLSANVSGVGGSLTRARPKEVCKYPIPIPPLNEQKRIADKVERLLSKIDEAKRLIDEARESFELRRAAILDKAFRGELTAKWRQQEHPDDDASELIAEIRSKMGKHDREIALDHDDNNLLPEGWLWVKIRDIFAIYGGGTPSKSKPEYWNGDIPWVSPKDMKTLFINYTADTITQVGVENSSTKLASTGSIVMVVRSGILQRKLPVAMLMKDSAVNQDMKIFDSGIVYVNKYLMWYIHGYQKKLLKQYTKSGTTVNSIEFDKFKEHFIPLPSKKELIQIVNLVEHFLSKEDQIIANLDHIANIEKVKQSILSKAFRGELCTNDPTEESAIELLKEVIASKK
jgi:type I restriction enzyme, S subunit